MKVDLKKGQAYECTLTVKLIRTATGKLRIVCGGSNVLVPDTGDNMALYANLEVEMMYAKDLKEK